MTAILGISAFYHDAAAALVVDGEIVAAAEEERFSRRKHDHGFPVRALEYCLREAGLGAEDVDYVGFYDKPVLKFDRLLETYLAFAPQGFRSFVQAMPLWLRQKLHLPRELDRGLGGRYRRRYVFTHHHESHAASAFFPSPFEEAAILTLDGVGEWSTTTLGVGRGNRVQLLAELRFPHSIGLLYSAFTYFTGFKVNSDEYKLMGLAPYGEPVYADVLLDRVVHLADDGSIHLDLSYFAYCQGLTMTSRKMEALFGGPPRAPEAPIGQREMDLAASVQRVTEEIVLRCARELHARTGMRRLCMAGGVALNCVANGRLLREGPFTDVWVQPAAGDAGGALGVALFVWHQLLDNPRAAAPRDRMHGALLGPRFEDAAIRSLLDAKGARYERQDDEKALCDRVAAALAAGQVVGWVQGRMEFGPRALGSRSILGDPRQPSMQSRINQKVKFREGFRPFAPAVLQEEVHEWFETRPSEDSPYMLLVCPVHPARRLPVAEDAARGLAKLAVQRSTIPAVTHVDCSARIQTVDAERHGLYRQLLEAFHRHTGCPVVVNTSFNLSWEPIVCTPEEAYATFMACDIDVLCIGHYVLEKTAQPAWTAASPTDRVDEVLDAILRSPCCGARLERLPASRRCAACSAELGIDAGIARLGPEGKSGRGAGAPAATSLRALLDEARRDPWARALDASIPYNVRVLVAGCGTGGLANLLGVGCRRVVGVDASLDALRAAEDFRARHGLQRVRFVHAAPDGDVFVPESFDVVIYDAGRAGDPDLGALVTLAARLRPGGYLCIGQSRPALHGALRALAASELAFVRSLPPAVPAPGTMRPEDLFAPAPQGGGLDHAIAALGARLGGRGGRRLLPGWRLLVVGRKGN